MEVVPATEFAFEVTFDSPSLDVASSVYDVTSGTPTLVTGPDAMTAVDAALNTYFGQFTPTNNKQYVIVKAVYTDGTFATLDTTYAQGSESVLCKNAAGGGGDPGAVWDELLADHTTPGTFGWFVQKLLTVAKFLGLQ